MIVEGELTTVERTGEDRSERVSRPIFGRLVLGIWLTLSMCTVGVAAQGFEAAIAAGLADGEEEDVEDLEVGLELRWPTGIRRLAAVAGLSVTEKEAIYGYGGVRLAIDLGARWRLAPGFAAGLYEQGDGKDLGHVLEFRSSLELAYATSRRTRLGALFYHISNASISETNPGRNSLLLTFSWDP